MQILGIDIQGYLIKGFLWTRKRIVYHSLFWLTMLIVLVALGSEKLNIGFRFLLEGTNVLFYMIITYINIFFLIPSFLSQRRREWTFIGSLILACAIITPIKVTTLFILLSDYPQRQEALKSEQFLTFLGLVYIGGFSTIYSIIAEWKEQERQRKELQSQTIASELRFLKTQINPHFLFNTLNSLYALTLKKSDDAPEVVLQLSEMMRYMLYECNEPQVPLAKEISYIENYLNLEKMRLQKNIDIRFDIDGNVSDIKVAPLLFIPFIENSFKHGVANQIGNGHVYIKITCNDNLVVFEIENTRASGQQFNAHIGKKSGGIGLVNVQRRLDLLYPNKNTLTIEENLQVYKVKLSIIINEF